jgi:hypothetical protein
MDKFWGAVKMIKYGDTFGVGGYGKIMKSRNKNKVSVKLN